MFIPFFAFAPNCQIGEFPPKKRKIRNIFETENCQLSASEFHTGSIIVKCDSAPPSKAIT